MTHLEVLGADAPHRLRERIGAWAFRQRSWTPVPLALVLVAVSWNGWRVPWLFWAGEGLVVLGLALRFWCVRHIGTVSRTRAARFGPLVSTGPFALVRNPLYIANFLLWVGFSVSSGLLWMVPVACVIFAVQYGAIARFEEAALIGHFGKLYAEYSRVVPRWVPRLSRMQSARYPAGPHSWREVAFSERGTLIAAAVMTLSLLAKYRWLS